MSDREVHHTPRLDDCDHTGSRSSFARASTSGEEAPRNLQLKCSYLLSVVDYPFLSTPSIAA
jgi:hypothetical protein